MNGQIKLKPSERDVLLVKLEERTQNIWKSIEKIEGYQSDQNEQVLLLIAECSKNTGWRGVSKWMIGGIWAAIVTIVVWLNS